jgi:hypothetical protein
VWGNDTHTAPPRILTLSPLANTHVLVEHAIPLSAAGWDHELPPTLVTTVLLYLTATAELTETAALMGEWHVSTTKVRSEFWARM